MSKLVQYFSGYLIEYFVRTHNHLKIARRKTFRNEIESTVIPRTDVIEIGKIKTEA